MHDIRTLNLQIDILEIGHLVSLDDLGHWSRNEPKFLELGVGANTELGAEAETRRKMVAPLVYSVWVP